MGQIVSTAAKPKRCNKNQLSQLGVLAAGLHVLVSSDNSMNAAGQGNFDCYIVGDGTTAATALPLHSIADEAPTAGSKNSVTSGGVYDGFENINTIINGENIFIQAQIGSGGKITFNTISLSENGDAIEFLTERAKDDANKVGRAFLTKEGVDKIIVCDGIIGCRTDNNSWQTGYNFGSGQKSVGATYTGVRTFKLSVENGNLVLYQNGTQIESQPLGGTISFDTLCGSYNGTEWVGTLKTFKYTHAGITYDVNELQGFSTTGDVVISYDTQEGLTGRLDSLETEMQNSVQEITERIGVTDGRVGVIEDYVLGHKILDKAIIGANGKITFNTISLSQNGDAIEFQTTRDSDSANKVGRSFLMQDDTDKISVLDSLIGVRRDSGSWQTEYNFGQGQAATGATYNGLRVFCLKIEDGNLVLSYTYNGTETISKTAALDGPISFNTLCSSFNGTDWVGTLNRFKYTHDGVEKDLLELDGVEIVGDVEVTFSRTGDVNEKIADVADKVALMENGETKTIIEKKIVPYTDYTGYVDSDTGEIVPYANGNTSIIDVSGGNYAYIRTYQTPFGSNKGYGFVLDNGDWIGYQTTQAKEIIIPIPENAITFKMAWSLDYITQQYFYLGTKANTNVLGRGNVEFQFKPDFDLTKVPSVNFIAATSDINDVYGRYDALMETYPNYITKVDCSDADSVLGITRPSYLNNIPIYMYCFKPSPVLESNNYKYVKKPSALILTGVHADEKMGIYTTYSLMKMICENWRNDVNAEMLRTMADIYVIPLVNPWGFINAGTSPSGNPYAGRTNYNGVNLNRNFPSNDWHSADTSTIASGNYPGNSAGSEYETKIVCYYAKQITPDVFFDWHTGNMNVYGDMGAIECIGCGDTKKVCLATSKSMSLRLIKDNSDYPADPDTILISNGTFNKPNAEGYAYTWAFENITTLSFLTEQCIETKWKDGVLTQTVQSTNTDEIYRENLQFSYNILLRALYAASPKI